MPLYTDGQKATLYADDYKPLALYKDGEKVAGWHVEEKSGQRIEFDGTYNDKFEELTVYGKSEQKQYKGYNLVLCDKSTLFDAYTSELVSDDGNNNTITLESNGGSWSGKGFKIPTKLSYGQTLYCKAEVETDYNIYPVISIEGWRNSSKARITNTESIVSSTYKRFVITTPSDGQDIDFYVIRFSTFQRSGESVKGETITYRNIMVTTQSGAEFEPYVGGEASPNINFPQEVEELNASIKVLGKNKIYTDFAMWKEIGRSGKYWYSYSGNVAHFKSELTLQNWYEYNSNMKFKGNAFSSPYIIVVFDFMPLTDNYIDGSKEHTCFVRMQTYNSKGVRLGWYQPYIDSTSEEFWIQKPKHINEWNKVIVRFYRSHLMLDDVDYGLIGLTSTFGGEYYAKNIMVIDGDYENDMYEPYRDEQTIYVTGRGIEVPTTSERCNYIDKSGKGWCCDTIDFGKGKVVRRVGNIEIDKTARWAKTQSSEEFCLTGIGAVNPIALHTKVLCNYFPYGSRDGTQDGVYRENVLKEFPASIGGRDTYTTFAIAFADRYEAKRTLSQFLNDILGDKVLKILYQMDIPNEEDLDEYLKTLPLTTILESSTDRVTVSAKVAD